MKLKTLFVLLPLMILSLTAQENVKIFPGYLNIQPFTANMLEPKLGYIFHINDNELRLDVGNTMDALHFDVGESGIVSVGFDLFTYTLLRGETDFHFPVDAVDYLFGLNAGYKNTCGDSEYGLRFRLSHISAHFVDGHYDNKTQDWRDGLNPRVYSREFVEFMPFFKIHGIRMYAGLTYIFHVDPKDLGKDSYQLGFDYFFINDFSRVVTPFIAYDFKLVNIYEYTGNNSFGLGVKLGNPNAQGVSFYFSYYSGNSIHGQYFDKKLEYSALGVNLDL